MNLLATVPLYKGSDLSRFLGVKDLIDFSWEFRPPQVPLCYEALIPHLTGTLLTPSEHIHRGLGVICNCYWDCSGLFSILSKPLALWQLQEPREAPRLTWPHLRPDCVLSPCTFTPLQLRTRNWSISRLVSTLPNLQAETPVAIVLSLLLFLANIQSCLNWLLPFHTFWQERKAPLLLS